MNPLDAVLEHPHMTKQAIQLPLPGMGRGLGAAASAMWQGARGAINPAELGSGAMKGFGGALGAGAAVAAGTAAKKEIYDSIEARRVYKEMVQLAPQLEDARQQDPRMFNASYNALRRINPLFAGDPLVAGALMQQMLNPEANDRSRFQTLSSTVRPPEAPKNSVMIGGKAGPFQVSRSI